MPIEESGITLARREDVSRLIEPPLRGACQALYDKNIETSMSSANKKDLVNGEVYITIFFDSLSPENQEVAKSLSQVYEYGGRKYVKITIPVTATTTVSEVEKAAIEIADKFKKQHMNWAPNYSLEEMRVIFADPKLSLEDLKGDPNLFFDEERGRFYLSEEHSRKSKEKIFTQ